MSARRGKSSATRSRTPPSKVDEPCRCAGRTTRCPVVFPPAQRPRGSSDGGCSTRPVERTRVRLLLRWHGSPSTSAVDFSLSPRDVRGHSSRLALTACAAAGYRCGSCPACPDRSVCLCEAMPYARSVVICRCESPAACVGVRDTPDLVCARGASAGQLLPCPNRWIPNFRTASVARLSSSRQRESR